MLLLTAACAFLAAPAVAHAETLRVTATAGFSNVTAPAGNTPNPIYCGASGQPSCASFGLPSAPPFQVRWGSPISGNPTERSGLGFAPQASQLADVGTSFALGALTHFNFPIAGSTAAGGVTLTINVTATTPTGVPVFNAAIPWTLVVDETPNQGVVADCPYPSVVICSDAISFALPAPTPIAAPGGRLYVVNFAGFKETLASATTLDKFISQEGGQQTGFMIASIADETVQAHAIDDNFETLGAPVNGDVRANDTDVSTVSLGSPPSHGTVALNPNGTFTYTPAAGFRGVDSFRYVGASSTGFLSIATVSIRVGDFTPPELTLPADITVEATGERTPVSYTPTATDNVDPSPAIDCAPPSGTPFPVGTFNVMCTARDAAGNVSAPGVLHVTVQDTTDPTWDAEPADITREATSAAGAAASWPGPTASDIADPSVAVSCDHAKGSTFPLGSTTVTCTATDDSGNDTSTDFVVTVVDTTAPTVDVPATVVVEAASAAGGVATFAATASDLVDGSVPTSCTPASGSTFDLGSTAVSCTATDAHDNTGSASFQVVVRDTTDPTWNADPADITREATSPAGAAASWTNPTASDTVDSAVAVTCDRAPGSTFPLGPTTVTCTATDDAGNTATTDFVVTVVDTTAPAITAPAAVTVNATSPTGAVATFTVTANDLVDGAVTPSCSSASGSFFPIGTTAVTCTATDAAHNTASVTFDVIVRSAAAQATALCAYIAANDLGPGSSLSAKCRNVSAAVAANDTADACSKLTAFLNEVRAQRGKKLTAAQADRLTADANRIRDILGC